jgi:pimeloyl-ACP methyl ester carboxylesterase
VAALADALGIERFSVVGWSAGGPHALAVAHHLPDRVAAVGLASPVGPLDAPGALGTVKSDFRLLWRLRHITPGIKLAARDETNKQRKDPARYIDNVWLRGAPAADAETIRLDAVRAMAEQEVAEAAKQGWAGYFDDLIAITRPWGFAPEDVPQSVTLWHGLQDSWLYPEMAKALAARGAVAF